jgi:hypothetical protein
LYGYWRGYYLKCLETSCNILVDDKKFDIIDYKDWISQYIFENGCKLVIDSHDSKNVDENLVRWSDVYLKVNMWRDVDYDENVFPFFGMFGTTSDIFKSKLNSINDYRNLDKNLDLIFVSKIWGGRDHMVNLFNAVGRVNCKKYLHAILFTDGDLKYTDRFDTNNVNVSKSGVPNLCEMMMKSKLVVVRNAKHLCIPFTMLEALSIGACVLVDSVPKVKWVDDLKEGVNYLSMGLNRPENTDPCKDIEYDNIKGIVESYLKDEDLMESIRRNNISYFDKNLKLESVCNYILEKVGYENIISC